MTQPYQPPQYQPPAPAPVAEPAKKKSNRKWIILGALAVAAIIGTVTDNDADPRPTVQLAPGMTGGTFQPTVRPPAAAPTTPRPTTPAPAPAPTPLPAPDGTVSQQNALRSAENYLDFTAFSRSGLIDQLEYEGFSTADATWAVDNVTVDWFVQAAESARSYLEYTAFSRSGLIDQLIYEGFSPEQAAHGADAVGL